MPLIIDNALVERCAKAAYEAVMSRSYLFYQPRWDDAYEHAQARFRRLARAVLTEALQPAPDPGPLDGQEPLIGET